MAYDCLVVLYLSSAALVFHAYLGYPLLVTVLARLWPKKRPMLPVARPSVSIIIAAFNEEGSVARRLEEFTSHIRAHNLSGELVIVSDGSTDRTAEIARTFADRGVRVLELPSN